MQYNVIYSLRKALEANIPEITKAQIIHDGARLDDLSKPYASIQYVQTLSESLSAGRNSYRDDIAISVGIHARDINELNRLESKIRNTVIRNPDGIPFYLYDESESKFVLTDMRLELDETSFTPMGADDATKESEYHKGYFVITTEVLRSVSEETFSQ